MFKVHIITEVFIKDLEQTVNEFIKDKNIESIQFQDNNYNAVAFIVYKED